MRIVLVDPREPLNVGAVCRAAKSMGMRDLTIVSNARPNLRAARITATHADDVLDAITVVPRLADAVQDCHLAAAITRRRGRWRKQRSVAPDELARLAAHNAGGIVAVVFGNETAGLDDADVQTCHVAVHIPTDPSCPSLNLSHAVQLICWELRRELQRPWAPRQGRPAALHHRADLVTAARARLALIGLFREGRHGTLRQLLHDVVARAGLSAAEVRRLRELVHTTGGLTDRWYGRRSGRSGRSGDAH